MEREGEEGRRLKAKLRNQAIEEGAALFGVADLTPARSFIEQVYGDELAHLSRAVAMAVFFPVGVVNQLKEGPTHTYLYYYNVLNARLDGMALRVANSLQDEGYEAFPIPASQRVSQDKLAGIFSHRLAANLAGLGWIGKNCALINPRVGPRLRLVTVLTNARLPADEPVRERCGRCVSCVSACPAGALKGVNFQMDDSPEVRFAASDCDTYLAKVRVTFGKRVCGRCLAVCPWGHQPWRGPGEQPAGGGITTGGDIYGKE